MSASLQAVAHQRGIEDVLKFLTLQTTVLPDFPATPTTLRLGYGQILSKEEEKMKGTPVLEGGALLRAMLGDHLPVLFSDQTPGVSTTVRDVLISDRVSVAVASYFGWQCPSLGITKQQLLWLMIYYCDTSSIEELGPLSLNRWAQEFYRPLAIIARSALYPTWAGKVYIAGLGTPKHRSDVDMEAYLARGKFSQTLDDKWLERFPVAQKILDAAEPRATEKASRNLHRLPRKRHE
ncbi:hypothetical protein DFH09DRAFT_1315942 [Mycena vulgaris]|nr:hypothetical protein DFH09DRAFT_1315942 [Mycena vulgaris]